MMSLNPDVEGNATVADEVMAWFSTRLSEHNFSEGDKKRIAKAFEAWVEATDILHRLRNCPDQYPSGKCPEWTSQWKKKKYEAKLELESVCYDVGEDAWRLIKQAKKKIKEAHDAMYTKENPDDGDPLGGIDAKDEKSSESWFTGRGMRNWLILAALGIGGYIVWKKWLGPKLASKGSATPQATVAQKQKTLLPSPPQSGWTFVKANQVASTASGTFIKKKDKKLNYAKILVTRVDRGYPVREFVPTVNGWFTGNLVKEGVVTWAEIVPA